MLAVNFIRTVAAKHVARRIALKPATGLATKRFNSYKISDKEIPIKTYGNEDLPTASSALGGSISNGTDTEAVQSILKNPNSTDPAGTATSTRSAPAHTKETLNKAVASLLPNTLKKFLLHDKVVVVTGGARGLGFNMAQALGECGAKAIAIMDVLQEHGDQAAAELHEVCGVPVRFYKVDVRDEKAVDQVISNVAEAFGSIDVVVNSAGIADSNLRAETYDSEKFRRLIDINLTGSFLVAQAAGKVMIKAGKGGSIVFIASMSGRIVNYPQEQSAYNASKAAVIQLGKSLAAEWAKYGVRVNCISPGYMDTALNRVPALEAQKQIWKGLTPQKRLGNVDELNNLAVFLASDASSFMTGADCIIDGGYSLW